MRVGVSAWQRLCKRFPFLFGGTFIEGSAAGTPQCSQSDFPSFSEGLSLRVFLFGLFGFAVSGISLPFLEGLSLRHDRVRVDLLSGC